MKTTFDVLHDIFNEMEPLFQSGKSVNYKEGVLDCRGIVLKKMQETHRQKYHKDENTN